MHGVILANLIIFVQFAAANIVAVLDLHRRPGVVSRRDLVSKPRNIVRKRRKVCVGRVADGHHACCYGYGDVLHTCDTPCSGIDLAAQPAQSMPSTRKRVALKPRSSVPSLPYPSPVAYIL